MATATSNFWNKQTPSEGSSTNAAETKRKKHTQESLPDKIKKLSNIAAIACFISVVAVGFGIWGIYNAAAQAAESTAGTKNIVVAKTQIAKGQTITADFLEVKAIPSSLQVEGSLDEDMLQSIVGSSAAMPLSSGAQLTTNSIVGLGGATVLASSITSGMTAISIDVGTASGIAGLICVGDYVSIVKPAATSSNSASTTAVSIVDKARVLALDSSTDSSNNSYTNVTLEVSPENALQVRQAQFAGSVSLILLSDANEQSTNSEGASSASESAALETTSDLEEYNNEVISTGITTVEN